MSQQRCFRAVWQYMTAFDSTYAVCDVCKKKLSYKTSLTNLKKTYHRSSWHKYSRKSKYLSKKINNLKSKK